MHRLDSLDDTADSDYNVGEALAAEGKTHSHVRTAEQEVGWDDYQKGRDAYLEDMDDAIMNGEDINIDDVVAVVDAADMEFASKLLGHSFQQRDREDW